MASSAQVKVIFGSMTIGRPGTLAAKIHSPEDAAGMLDVFKKYGHVEVDSSRQYGNGSTEELLAAADWKGRGLTMETKLYPNAGLGWNAPEGAFTHKPEDVRRGLMDSLKALKTDHIDMFYLHGPDRKHPYEDTLREVNHLHKEGYFSRFGISNFMSWEVAQICEICRKNGWIQPTVYQGSYNALQRRVEDELFPCLKFYGISFYAFQPLAGGFLTGRYQNNEKDTQPGSRFDPESVQGKMHRGRYWNDGTFQALDKIRTAANRHQLTLAEVAVRWLRHQSHLSAERGDGIIVGASNLEQLEGNLKDLEKGPLPQDVVEALDLSWPLVKGSAQKYWH